MAETVTSLKKSVTIYTDNARALADSAYNTDNEASAAFLMREAVMSLATAIELLADPLGEKP